MLCEPGNDQSPFVTAPQSSVVGLPAVPGMSIAAPFRYGCHYSRPAQDGSPAWVVDLYRRKGLWIAAALPKDVPSFPETDSLVMVEGTLIPKRDGGTAIWAKHLAPIPALGPDLCVFDTALPNWVVDQEVADRAVALWGSLPAEYRRFVNAVFGQTRVLRDFLFVPGSCRHHHAYDGGCLEHSVQTAEIAASIVESAHWLDRNLLVTGALVHDAGKALEYVRTPRGSWRMSGYGRRVGHKIAGVQLATMAMAHCFDMSASQKAAILHVLACSYAPAWAGLRAPASAEASLLAAIDRVSAESGHRRRAA